MRIEILSGASEDLLEGYRFYERQAPGLGAYFRDSLYSDIDLLLVNAGIHRIVYRKHRALSRRFPYAIYYSIEADVVLVSAILDCRRSISWTRRRLRRT